MPVLATIPVAYIATAALATAVVGTGIAAMGAVQSGQSQAASASYQSQVAANNAIIADQNAQYATASGEGQVSNQQLKTAATIGGIRANEAASGLDVNSGSDLDVQSSAKELGELDALTIRNNAARTAYGYQTGATGFTAQSGLDEAQSSAAGQAELFNATSSVLGGASSAGSKYASFLQAGVVGGGAPAGLSPAFNPVAGISGSGAGGFT